MSYTTEREANPTALAPRHASRGCQEDARVELERKRNAAKTGMALSLGALVATGLMRGRGAKILHVCSGVSLVGFSYWHFNLYRPPNRGRGK